MIHRISRRSFLRTGAALGAAVVGHAAGAERALRTASGQDNRPVLAVATGDDGGRCVRKAMELAGGMERFVSRGARVALLPNAQSRHPGSFTHPEVLRATVELCRGAGAARVDALSWLPERFWAASGLDKVLSEAGAGLVLAGQEEDFFRDAPLPKGKVLKTARLLKSLADYDVLVDMPIIKDHAGNKFTGTMKNLMGLNSPSCNRTFHLENWDTDPAALSHLDQSIADLNLAVAPTLCIVDATEVIATNGPFGPGRLVRPRKVLVGVDRVALDAYGATLLDLEPRDILMIRYGAEHGLGEIDPSKARILEAAA